MAVEAHPAALRPSPARRYPPLVMMAAILAVLAVILPSALRVPQTDPTPVLEYAPIPPEDEDPPNPPPGNLSALALGSSSTTVEGVEPPPPPPPPGETEDIVTKRCVGKPPRQTEDLMSPPCVAHFEGDNGGETWQGTSKDEIVVLIYLDNGCPNFECSRTATATGTYLDLDEPPKPQCPKTWPAPGPDPQNCDYIWIRVARAFNAYFNYRFQTYDRRVHFWAFMSNATTPAGRRADAAENVSRLKPFAVIDYATYFGNNQAYDSAVAARNVMVFTSRAAMPNKHFRASKSMQWGFWPDVEHWAEMYSSYVCTKVAPFPVSRGGNPPGTGSSIGDDRVYGYFSTTDPNEPGLRLFAKLVKQRLKRECGVEPAAEATFPSSGFLVERADDGQAQLEAIRKFRAAGVTTVLYLGGIEGKFSHIAGEQGWYPEVVLAGDLENDNNESARGQNQNFWANVWAMQFQLRMDSVADTIGAMAYREGSPTGPAEDMRFANEAYRDYFMLFQAIQVAGPRLTPANVDKGFHAIPEHSSNNPYVASCFFDPGDYTCVKDATEVWWDPSGQSPGDQKAGCWRFVSAGRRFLPGKWPQSFEAFANDRDPCTGFDSRFQISP